MPLKPRLGKGLNALIAQQTPPSQTSVASPISGGPHVQNIPVDHISPNPAQPRSPFTADDIAELAESIKIHGVLEPVLALRRDDGQYELIAGHRRTSAAKAAGLKLIPAIVRDGITPEQQTEWALIENIHREDLNPIDKAMAYRTYIDRFHLTHQQASQRLSQDRASISNYLRILDLQSDIRDMIRTGKLSFGHAKILAGLTDASRQVELATMVAQTGISVRELERLAAVGGGPADQADTVVHEHSRSLKSAHVIELEQELSRKLGTKLRIFPARRKGSGKLVIQYYSLDEFDRLVENLTGKPG
jgi:ParB family chromosome partitioning protein